MGYVCSTALSSNEALDQAAAHRPALVLMDIRIIGQMDGVEVAAELKRLHHLPVVFLTGNTDESTLQRAFRVEPDGYLSKPFTRATLRTAIEVAIQRHGVEGRLRNTERGELPGQKRQLENARRADLSEMGISEAVTALRRGALPSACSLGDSHSPMMSARSSTAREAHWPPPPPGARGAASVGFDPDHCRALCRATPGIVSSRRRISSAAPTSRPSPLSPPSASSTMTNGSRTGVLSAASFARMTALTIWAKEQLTTVLAQ